MTGRGEALQSLVDAAAAAFRQFAQEPDSCRSIRQIFHALGRPAAERSGPGARLPVCAHLDRALAVETGQASLRDLIDRFKAVEPLLEWRPRPSHDQTASDNFATGHANAMILGPGGLEDRKDVWLGVTLMAPHVRYPDHNHAPEETYLVLSDGVFRHGGGDWFTPGIGGSLYNEPNIRHAMRSADVPLFAFWALRPDQTS